MNESGFLASKKCNGGKMMGMKRFIFDEKPHCFQFFNLELEIYNNSRFL